MMRSENCALLLSAIGLLLLVANPSARAQTDEEDEESSFFFAGSQRNFLSVQSSFRNNSCTVLEGCDECIRVPGCAWCADHRFGGQKCDLAQW